MPIGGSGRLWIVAIAVSVTVAAAVLVAAVGDSSGGSSQRPAPEPGPAADALLGDGASLLVRGVDPAARRDDGPLYEISRDGVRRVGAVECKQVHMNLGGRGLCLGLTPDRTAYQGTVLGDAGNRVRLRFPVTGIPDRARVSPDGRHGAFTLFDPLGAQGYFATTGTFSVDTRIVDLRTGRELLNLADLEVTDGGLPVATPGREYWGVTFARDGRYYATLAANSEHHLIEGRVDSRRARVIRDRVECPSLSPGGTRIAYKRRIGYSNRWRLHVLDLESGRDVALAERRSIDDQPEWLDDRTVVYSDDEAVFAVPADGGGSARLLVDAATSPGALRRSGG